MLKYEKGVAIYIIKGSGIMESFKNQLKFLRTASKLTQKEVADFIGVKRVAYTSYESGRTSPNLETVVKLANLYNVTTDFLLNNFTNANAVLSDISSNYNEDDEKPPYFFNLTKDEKELVALFRVCKKSNSILTYAKKVHDKEFEDKK